MNQDGQLNSTSSGGAPTPQFSATPNDPQSYLHSIENPQPVNPTVNTNFPPQENIPQTQINPQFQPTPINQNIPPTVPNFPPEQQPGFANPAPIQNFPQQVVSQPPIQPQSSPEHVSSYGDLIANDQPIEKKGSNLISFLPNKVLFPLIGLIIGLIILAVFVSANRTTSTGLNTGSINDEMTALGSLLAYGKSNINNAENVRMFSETSLVLSSSQNVLAKDFFGITDATKSIKMSDEMASELESAKNVSGLEKEYYNQLKEHISKTIDSLKYLAENTGSAEKQANIKKALESFEELLARINSMPEPLN